MKKLTAYIFSILLLTACSTKETKNVGHDHAPHQASTSYTCPMHPQIVQDKAGQCPICKMELVKVSTSNENMHDVMLSDNQIKLANIATQRIAKKEIGQTVAINGRLTIDQEQSQVVSSRVEGRIEKLYIKETGQAIQKGQPLYVLYSEILLTLQQEYLLAKEQYEALGKSETRYKSFLDAAEKKLSLFGLTKLQIAQLTNRNTLQARVTFLAPSSGIVTAIKASEGQYISEGSLLYTIENMNSLWVEAELYPGETSLVKIGDKISVTTSGTEGNPIETVVTFLSPEYKSNTQITVLRASVPNPGMNLRPGQHVQIYLSHSSRKAMAIPVDAVIRDGKGAHLYVQVGHNTFRPRLVKIGLENFDQVEIIEGIEEGDTVAISGAYLLYSEIILKQGKDPATMATSLQIKNN